MSICFVCLRPIEMTPDIGYHTRCARALFGSAHVPDAADVDVTSGGVAAPVVAGRTARPAGQPGIVVDVTPDGKRLVAAPKAGRYLLTPQRTSFPELPENELLTMRLAEMAGLDVPQCGLVRVFDRSLAFLVRRVGPHGNAGDLRRESLCELAGKPAAEERSGSAELCAELVRRHASEPAVALFKLYRLMVFAWWVGDGDVHLGNLALATGPDNIRELAPLPDLLSTRLVIPDDHLALPVGGKTDRLTRADWLRYGDACGLRSRIVERVLGAIVSSFEEALGLISRSFLSEDAKVAYAELLGRRTAMLEALPH